VKIREKSVYPEMLRFAQHDSIALLAQHNSIALLAQYDSIA
jgi:hypothetical protein